MTNGAFWIDFRKEIFRYLGKKRIDVLNSSIFPSVFPWLSWGGCRLLMILQTFLVTIIWRIPRLDEIKKIPPVCFPVERIKEKYPRWLFLMKTNIFTLIASFPPHLSSAQRKQPELIPLVPTALMSSDDHRWTITAALWRTSSSPLRLQSAQSCGVLCRVPLLQVSQPEAMLD